MRNYRDGRVQVIFRSKIFFLNLLICVLGLGLRGRTQCWEKGGGGSRIYLEMSKGRFRWFGGLISGFEETNIKKCTLCCLLNATSSVNVTYLNA